VVAIPCCDCADWRVCFGTAFVGGIWSIVSQIITRVAATRSGLKGPCSIKFDRRHKLRAAAQYQLDGWDRAGISLNVPKPMEHFLGSNGDAMTSLA
jgi:hypothetical protein